MKIEKWAWACVRVVSENGSSVLIDPLAGTPGGQQQKRAAAMGEAREAIQSLKEIPLPGTILLTHIHPDHFDWEAVIGVYGEEVPVLLPAESVSFAERLGFRNVRGMHVGDSQQVGQLTVTATHSVDGFGTPQVAWVVKGDGHSVLHCGDTLRHGFWWKIAREHGPIDVACMPVNGAVLEVAGLPHQSVFHACLTPEEAVEASLMVAARALLPIHFGTFDNPPYYTETPQCLKRLRISANERGVNTVVLSAGQSLDCSKLDSLSAAYTESPS